jgi:hypothetical protein
VILTLVESTVNERDGLGISNEDSFTITAESAEAEILLMKFQ